MGSCVTTVNDLLLEPDTNVGEYQFINPTLTYWYTESVSNDTWSTDLQLEEVIIQILCHQILKRLTGYSQI